jgi:outer membrane protein TolC
MSRICLKLPPGSVPFFNGGKNVEGIFKAKADYLAAEEAAVSQRDETVAKLAEAWAFYADAIEDVDVKRKFLVASRKRAEIIRVQYTTGLAGFQDFDIAEQENADSERNYVESLANALVQQANWEQIKGESLEESLNEI